MDILNDDRCKDNNELTAILLPQHLEDLRRSGLSDETIRRCGFYSETDPSKWSKLLNWKSARKDAGAVLCIPFLDVAGEPLDYVRVKPDKPRKSKADGKPIKYESPKGAANLAFIPPGTRAALADPSKPLLITEGEKKAAKADQDGFACIGIVGVNGWMVKRTPNAEGRKEGPRKLISDLAAVDWRGRRVYIPFDSDIAEKPQVQWAEWHLAEVLTQAGAEVLIVRIPAAADGSKQGLDDFLIAAGAEGLNALLEAATPPVRPVIATDDRPEIVLDHEEHRVNDEAVATLARDEKLYQRGGLLVQVVETEVEDDDAVIRRPAGSVVIREVPPALLRESLTRSARLLKIKMTADGPIEVPTHPPEWMVNGVHKRHSWPRVRKLDAVVTYPVLLPDGSVLTEAGYHSKSKLYASFPPGLKLTIPERPTKADVRAAINTLFDPLTDFPFETPAHRSAWLAGLLTPLAWFAFDGPAPFFLIDGNVRGVGKGLLADVISFIVTGRRFATMAYTNDREELRKKITSLAVEGERLILLDNLAGAVGNDILDNALTSTQWKDRLLGGNRVFDGPLNLAWYGTGNNVQLHADTSRRVCHIRMETPDERPELKSGFKYPNLRGHVLQHRGRLLSAALTILRGWIVGGRPKHGLPPWGSFEGWSDVVREAIVFAGLEDPGETRLALQTLSDRDAAAMETILRGMIELDTEGRGLTAAEIIGKLRELPDDPPEWMPEMRSAIEELCGRFDGRILGVRFRLFQKRTFNGKVLIAGGAKNGSNRWTVRRLEDKAAPPSPHASPSHPETGDEGDKGDASVPPEWTRQQKNQRDWQSQMLPD